MTKLRDEVITLAHGSGGRATHTLVEQVFVEELRNPVLEELGDAAVGDAAGARLAFTTDSYVVKPLFFPGGDIGALAVNGTVNDLAVAGAEPLWLSAGFVVEEGFPVGDLRRIAARWRMRRRPPAWPSSPATPRSSSAGAPTACS